MKPKRGYVYSANLNPRHGTEPGKIRPVLVIQTDLINSSHPSVVVCPLTTHVKSEVEILRIHLRKGEAGLREASDVMIDQIRAIDNGRLKRELGKLSQAKLTEVEKSISIILDLS